MDEIEHVGFVDAEGRPILLLAKGKADYFAVTFYVNKINLRFYILGHTKKREGELFTFNWNFATRVYFDKAGEKSAGNMEPLFVDIIEATLVPPIENNPEPKLVFIVQNGKIDEFGLNLQYIKNSQFLRLRKARGAIKEFLYELPKGGAPKGNTNTKIIKSEEEKAEIISKWDQVRHKSRIERDRYSEIVGISIRTLQRWYSESTK